MQLTLYYAPIACSLVPYVALTEAGANFDIHVVNFAQQEHLSAEYLKINPKHRVPVLSIDGIALTENVAIQLWIARNFPQARLLPSDPMQEAQAVSLLAWFASGVHPTLTPNARPERYCDLPGSEASVRRCAQALMSENFAIADAKLAGREWFFDHFTTADAYFYWCFRRAKQFRPDFVSYANCEAHLQRMQRRSSVQKLIAYEAKLLAEMQKKA